MTEPSVVKRRDFSQRRAPAGAVLSSNTWKNLADNFLLGPKELTPEDHSCITSCFGVVELLQRRIQPYGSVLVPDVKD